MKINSLLLFGILFMGISSVNAQEKTSYTLDEAIQMAWSKSNVVILANTKVNTSKYELQTAKNKQYPDLKASGQYMRLSQATVDLKTNQNNSSTSPTPVIDQLMIGQVNASIPIFSGFKIRNSINLSQNLYQAEAAMAAQTKEEIAMKVISLYARLYKSQKTLELLKDNQKQAEQRSVDFSEMEKNGIIPRNDLLKAQLQLSNIQLSIDETKNNLNVVNYNLISILKLPENTELAIRESDFSDFKTTNIPSDDVPAIENRKDLEALNYHQKAAEANVKIAKSNYYPSLSIQSGYTVLDVKNLVIVENAINFGFGISYDISNILKNKSTVNTAENKSLEIKTTQYILIDNIKIQVKQAIENYQLSLKQSQVYRQAFEQASENYRIIKDKYDNGLSDTNNLLEADVEQLSSKINTALARANIILKYYELLSATGQLSKTFNLSKI
jgi:outer membrane protein TolC